MFRAETSPFHVLKLLISRPKKALLQGMHGILAQHRGVGWNQVEVWGGSRWWQLTDFWGDVFHLEIYLGKMNEPILRGCYNIFQRGW